MHSITPTKISQYLHIIEDAIINNLPLYVCYVDIQKAFDTVPWEALWDMLRAIQTPQTIIDLLQNIYYMADIEIATPYGNIRLIKERGLHQGCPFSPILFLFFLEPLMQELGKMPVGVPTQHGRINTMGFVDDLLLLTLGKNGYQEIRQQWHLVVTYLKHYGMNPGIDTAGTKTRFTSTNKTQKGLEIKDHPDCTAPWIDPSIPYKYLGINITLTENPTQAQIMRTTKTLALDLKNLNKPKLSPVQYTRVLNMKIIPRIRYIMRAHLSQHLW